MSVNRCPGCGGEIRDGECIYCGYRIEQAEQPPAPAAGELPEPDDPILQPYWMQYQQVLNLAEQGADPSSAKEMEELYRRVVALREQHEDAAAFMQAFQTTGLLQEYTGKATSLITAGYMAKINPQQQQ